MHEAWLQHVERPWLVEMVPLEQAPFTLHPPLLIEQSAECVLTVCEV